MEFMGDADAIQRSAPNKDFCELWVCPQKLGLKSYGSPHALPIHFCFQRLHLWVTASAQDLVYRDLIRKYFGTEIMKARKSIMAAGFSAEARENRSIGLGRASV